MILEGARWSSVARCPLQGALTATSATAAEPDDQTRRYFARGHLFENYVADQLAAKHGATNIRRQIEVPWGKGWTGHADAIVTTPDARILVEVVSTTAPKGVTVDQKITQLRGYWHFLERDGDTVDSGLLYIVNPSDLSREDALPVLLRDADRAEVEALEEIVVRAAETGELPSCCKASPTECRYNACPYTDVAWADWTPPDPTDVDATPELIDDLRELESYKSAVSQFEGQKKRVTSEMRVVQSRIAAVVPVGKSLVGGFKVTRTPVKKETLALKQARAAGQWTPLHDEMLGPFVSLSEYDVFKVERVEGRPLVTAAADNYGSVPF